MSCMLNLKFYNVICLGEDFASPLKSLYLEFKGLHISTYLEVGFVQLLSFH